MKEKMTEESRRRFLKQSSAGLAASLGTVGAGSALAAQASKMRFDAEYDIVVVGGGGGGLPAALFSRWHGNKVLVLEKAPTLGGTSFKAAYWYWVPNNAGMRAAGMEDPKPDFLRYVARLTAPQSYDPEHPRFGLNEWEYAMCEAIYDSASPAAELLAQKGALPYRHIAEVPDYFAELETKGRKGRVLFPKEGSASMSDGGQVATRTLTAAARRDGVVIKTGHRVERVIQNAKGAVIGVEASTEEGQVFRARARKAVIFATGGFTHNAELRKNFLNMPLYGGCAALTNEGDFVRISSSLGVQLRNMNHAWMCPISLEKAIARDGSMSGMFSNAGDSMIMVSKEGKRVVNEKLQYNELAQKFFEWDGQKVEYPNLVLLSIWDQRAQQHSASNEYGRMIVPPGGDDRHVIKGATLEELARNISDRLKKYHGVIGGMTLSDDFVSNLKASIARFNGFAQNGKDLDFQRGDRIVEHLFNGDVKEEANRKNATMWPISETGPYYAALVTGGTLDTKGGPKTNTDGQVLDSQNKPIPGLYGVGNCVASASGGAYWAGGATLGPIIAFAYRAANKAAVEPVKTGEPVTPSDVTSRPAA
ncbi:FAD-dependent oxidoreductase [Pseudoduganella sp. UC29_106]|uniref:FAD-dependent oxidoreductase n=1 Tax=Pseudoduganella sp. UC29_106 TaxID=3374553 RepID=UPI0037564060